MFPQTIGLGKFALFVNSWSGLMGGVDGFLYALITFIIIDYVTEIMGAILQKKLSSDVGFKGIFKKILFLQ